MPAKKTAKKARKKKSRKKAGPRRHKLQPPPQTATGGPTGDLPWPVDSEGDQAEKAPQAPASDDWDAPSTLPDVVLDRSTVQRYTECPLEAWAVETGKVRIENRMMVSGQECHRILSEAVCAYAEDGLPPRDYLEQETVKARPDVQPDVVDGLKRCSWQIQQMLTNRSAADLVVYDGGEGDRSGQLSVELLPATPSRGRVMITSEIDLLLAGNSSEELHEIDWKSGRANWTSADVRNSFQFQLHSWLIMRNFPGVKQVLIKVFMTRFGSDTGWVVFTDKHMTEIEGRLLMAVQEREIAFRMAEEGNESEIPCHHPVEDLASCMALHLSKSLVSPHRELADDPGRFARDTMILDAVVSNRQMLLKQWIERTGENIVGEGFEYGVFAAKEKKPTLAQYKGLTNEDAKGQSLRDQIAEQMLKPPKEDKP